MNKELRQSIPSDQVYVLDHSENPKQKQHELSVTFYFDKEINKTDAMVSIAELLVDTNMNAHYSFDMWVEGYHEE